MDFIYYVVRKQDNVILDGASDMVGAINIGQRQNCACLIMQACVITEVGQDETFEEQLIKEEEVLKPEIITEDNIEAKE